MSSFQFKLNRAGVRELMQSEAMQNVLISHASAVKQNAGDGYDVYVGRNRANVRVGTRSDSAKRDNMDNNTLLKATGATGLSMK